MLFGADSCLEDLDTSPSCKDSGEILDSHLSFNEHTDYLSSSLLGKLCQINRVRHLFTKAVLSVILHLEQQNITPENTSRAWTFVRNALTLMIFYFKQLI